MMRRPHLIITSIQPPNAVMRAYAEQCAQHGFDFIVVGDLKSPKEFVLAECRFSPVDDPTANAFAFAKACPTGHYARKNIGYLLAMQAGAPLIVETDDDNLPLPAFWGARQRVRSVATLDGGGWANMYRYFSDANIWPRGLPLDCVLHAPPPLGRLPVATADCPIQQGLADDNPDVDAIYRLTLPLPQFFRAGVEVAIGAGSWCPFNSQNTAWWPEAYPLLYLPSYCSFRMTDIWRSFVGQRIAWANGWRVLFHSPTVVQARNDHDLMRDFEQEVPGYLGNARIVKLLAELDIAPGTGQLFDGLRRCYRALAEQGFVGREELPLLDLWIEDYRQMTLV